MHLREDDDLLSLVAILLKALPLLERSLMQCKGKQLLFPRLQRLADEHRVRRLRQAFTLFFRTRAEFATSFIIQSKRAAARGGVDELR